MPYQNDFVPESKQLRNKGQQLSQLHQIYKALGLVTTGVSGIAILTSGGALLPLIAGLVAYGGSVLSENQRTRKLKPLPWVSNDLTAISSGALHQETPATLGTQAHHYLDPEDKALFYLTNFQGHKLSQVAQQMEPEQFSHILTNLVDHLVTAHEPALNHPELLGQALQTDFFEIAIANLPKVASAEVGAKTRLGAVDVQALPVANTALGQSSETRMGQGDPETQPTDPQLNTPQLLAKLDRSSIILGAPGAGKGYALGSALNMVPADVAIWLIDPKNDPTEQHYWNRIPLENRLQFNTLQPSTCPSPEDIASFVFEFFDTHGSSGNALLVIDEIPALSNYMSEKLFKNTMQLCAVAASSGRSRKLNVWLVTQDSTVSQLGFSGQSRAAFGTYAFAALPGAKHPTPGSWFGSFNQSMKVKPPEGIRAPYIVSDCTRWYASVVPAFPQNAIANHQVDDEPPVVDMGSIRAEADSLNSLLDQTAEHPNEPSAWAIAKAQMVQVDSPLLSVIEWIENRQGKEFTLTLAKENKQLRTAVDGVIGLDGDSPRSKIEWAIKTLFERELLTYLDGSYRQV